MKNDTYTPEEIQKKFDALPSDIKTLVYGADMLSVIQKVREKHKLHIDQFDPLEAEIADVMTGFSKPEKFASNLAESLGINQQTADAIAQDINEQLFVKIRESMKKVYEVSRQTTDDKQPTMSDKQPIPVQTKPPELHLADKMLTEKTVSVSTLPASSKATQDTAPLKPGPYKTDPYHEPPE